MSRIVGEPKVIQFLSYNWPHSERLKNRTFAHAQTGKLENWKEIPGKTGKRYREKLERDRKNSAEYGYDAILYMVNHFQSLN